MKYLAVLGRQTEISLAELEALFDNVKQLSKHLAIFNFSADAIDAYENSPDFIGSHLSTTKNFPKNHSLIDIDRLGGCLKIGVKLESSPLNFLQNLPEGKITLGVSDYSNKSTKNSATNEALKLKKILVRHGRSVRVVENKDARLSTATSLHNGLSGKNPRKVELIKFNNEWFRVVGVQDIDAYARRDQKRPARDAKVGMLPPKLAQILINLCGNLPKDTRVLDPFCGTGVILQEALLLGYSVYGTDIDERMIEYTKHNLEWLFSSCKTDSIVSWGDATNFEWQKPIGAVACEGYLGKPMSQIPTEIKLKEQKQECKTIILGFLKNLSKQIKKNTPVVMAIPAWLRENGSYERLKIIDEIDKLGYNVSNKTREGLIYHRDKQIVARDILILRKK